MKRLLLFVLIVGSFGVYGQVPEPAVYSLKTYGGNNDDGIFNLVSKTSDGGFILAITTSSGAGIGNLDSFCSSAGSRNIFIKYNADASIQEWNLCTSNGDYLFPIDSGHFILGGNTNSTSSGWAYKISCIDDTGGIIWRKTYGNGADAILKTMIATGDGGYIMAGEINYTDTNFLIHHGGWMDADIGVIKVSASGNKVWSKVIGGTYGEGLSSMVSAPDGGCYLVGNTYSDDFDCSGLHGVPNISADVFLVRLDGNGNIIWHHDLGGSGSEAGLSCTSDGKGGVIIAARTNSNDGDVNHYLGNGDFWVLDVDSNNHISWENCYGTVSSNEIPFSVCKATDGSVWVNGVAGHAGNQVDTNYGLGDAWIVHIDSVGNFLNSKTLGSSGSDEGKMIHALSNGNVIAGGYYSGNSGSFSYYDYFGQSDAFLMVLEPRDQTGVNLLFKSKLFTIFPNPATDRVKIGVRLDGTGCITIVNCLGQIMYTATVKQQPGNLDINTGEWSGGLYIVKWVGDDGRVVSGKLVVGK